MFMDIDLNPSEIRKHRSLTLKDIARIANEVSKKYMVGDRVDLLAIAEDENIHVVKNSDVPDACKLLSGEHAKIYYFPQAKGRKWIIIYEDDNRSLVQRRNSVAHELGHYFLQHHVEFYEKGPDSKRENQADLFALALLSTNK